MSHYINPTLLGIVPPMDLGRSTDIWPSSLPEEGISPFPMKLRTHDNSRPTVGSVGLFGARRGAGDARFMRSHEGVDLLAPIGTPIFAVQTGSILDVNVGADGSSSVLIEHTLGMRYLTFYQHLQNVRLTVFRRNRDDSIVRDSSGAPIIDNVFSGVDAIGRPVVQGERVAEVGNFSARDDHLHFEIRYPLDLPAKSRANTLPVDPTWALYAWEKRRYRNDDATRFVVSAGRITELDEIIRGRLLRFLRVRAENFNRSIYLPVGHIDEEDRSLVETARWAFFHRFQVELAWRDSLFFNQIEFLFSQNEKIPILAELRVIAA